MIATLNKQEVLHLFPEEEWCNSSGWSPECTVAIESRNDNRLVVRNQKTGKRQRLIHSTGPKWWRPDGQEHFSRCGDVLDCFRFFQGMRNVNDLPSKDALT